jgi:hypothetical protein
MLRPQAEGSRPATIFWHGKGDICFTYIEAQSLSLALAFERTQLTQEPHSTYLK